MCVEMIKLHKRLFSAVTKPKNVYDYIVVGGGSSGCVLAHELSKDNKTKVLLLEAGLPRGNYPWFYVPVGYLFTINNPRSDWCFKTEPSKYLHNRSLLYPRGLGLGGSSLINGMIYMRGQEQDYNNWANLVNDQSWNWENILPLFLKHENYHGSSGKFHGKGGKWNVEKVRTQWEILEEFIHASEKYGIPKSNDFNTGNNTGVGYFDVNQNEGWRLNAYDAFKETRSNLTVMSSVHVHNVLLSHDENQNLQCIGVRTQKDSIESSFYAEKEVILTAGAIGSVQILERSGIGRSEVLEHAKVKVVHELPGVGENLQDHLQLRLVYEIDNAPTLNSKIQSFWGLLQIGYEYLFHRSGPLASAPSQLGAFWYSSPDFKTPNIQYHIQPLSLPAFGQSLDSFNGFTASVCDLRPTSRGSVHISSTDLRAHPKIQPNYLSTDEDQEVAADAINVTRDIVSKMDPKYNPREKKPGLKYQTKADLIQAAGEIGTTIFHPVGTCKMGTPDDPTAVVDQKLRVIGVKNLRVADCSIMPLITSGNTAAPAMMIGEKCAQMILQEK